MDFANKNIDNSNHLSEMNETNRNVEQLELIHTLIAFNDL